jgi:hypothetical protein
MNESGPECGQWFAQPFAEALFAAEYRVTLVGAAGSFDEEAFPPATGWAEAPGGGRGSAVHYQMVNSGDFVVPVGATTEGVDFDNTKSDVSREAIISAARAVRLAVASLGGTRTAAARNLSLRVDLARLVVDVDDDRDTCRVVCIANEMNGLLPAASICIDTAVFPEVATAIARALRAEARRRLVLDTSATATV